LCGGENKGTRRGKRVASPGWPKRQCLKGRATKKRGMGWGSKPVVDGGAELAKRGEHYHLLDGRKEKGGGGTYSRVKTGEGRKKKHTLGHRGRARPVG